MINEVLSANNITGRLRDLAMEQIKTDRYLKRILIIGYLRKRHNLSPECVFKMQTAESFVQYERETNAP